MHTKLINISLRYRMLVILSIVFVTVFGIYQYLNLPVDAFPDVSPIMVPVFTEADGMAPEEVERLISFPIESAMNGLPDIKQIKSTSAFGMSVVYVYFNDDVDMYFARQIVAERLTEAASQLPDLPEKPKLGPISSGLGQVFTYYLSMDAGTDTEGKDPTVYLRDVNDWIVKYQLQTVSGVTDILSIGGYVLQYHINVNPNMLQQYNLSLDDVNGKLIPLLEKYPDLVNDMTTGGAQPLHMCGMSRNKQNAVRALVKRGADVEALDTYGMTPLHRMA